VSGRVGVIKKRMHVPPQKKDIAELENWSQTTESEHSARCAPFLEEMDTAGSRDVFELRADREEVHARSARRPATAPPRVQASAFTSVVEPPTLPCVHEEVQVQVPVLSDAERLATVQQYHRVALKEQMQRVAGDRKPCSLRPRVRIWEQELAAVRIRLGRAKTPAKRLAAWQAVEQRFACCTKGRQPVAHAPELVVAVDRPPQARHRPPPGVLPAQPASDASTHRQPPTASCVRAPKSLYGPCERSENSSPTRASHQSPSRPSRGMRTPIRGGFNSARVAPSLGSSTGATGTIPRRACKCSPRRPATSPQVPWDSTRSRRRVRWRRLAQIQMLASVSERPRGRWSQQWRMYLPP
jgi:hypothetical protein